MYIIINKTQNKNVYYEGNFPDMYEELERGDDIIIVSLYSNTIKIPYISDVEYGENIWEWKEYRMELLDVINNHLKNHKLWESLKM